MACVISSCRAGTSSRYSSSVGPVYQPRSSPRSTSMSPIRADIGRLTHLFELQRQREGLEAVVDLLEPIARPVHRVHLVHGQQHARDADPPRQERVTPRLRLQSGARVHQQHRHVGRAGRRHHVARVLHVPRRVADDELPRRRREVAVGHVDRDALLALGQQAVGDQRQVDFPRAALARRRLERRDVVRQQALAVVEQAADQRALAVVHAARGDEPQQARWVLIRCLEDHER